MKMVLFMLCAVLFMNAAVFSVAYMAHGHDAAKAFASSDMQFAVVLGLLALVVTTMLEIMRVLSAPRKG